MATRLIKLEPGEMIQLSFLPARIAEALHDDEQSQKGVRKVIAAELSQMIKSGELTVLDPLSLEPLRTGSDSDASGHGVLRNDDLRTLLEQKGIALEHCGPKEIFVSAQHKHISVIDAITLVIDAAYCPDGVMEDGFTRLEQFVINIESRFLSVCEKLGIHPRLPYDPDTEFIGGEEQFGQFQITVDELQRYAAHYGVDVSLNLAIPEAAASETRDDTSANAASAKTGNRVHDVSASKARTEWPLREPERFDSLQHMVYEALTRAKEAGEPLPNAREVMKSIANSKHLDYVEHDSDGLKYINNKNDCKIASVDAIQRRINRLTDA